MSNGERKDGEENAANETNAVELKEESEPEAENIDEESDGKTEEQGFILNEIIDIWSSGEQSLHMQLKNVDTKKLCEWVRKMNDITGGIWSNNIKGTYDLINAISIFIAWKIDLNPAMPGGTMVKVENNAVD